MGEKQTQRIEGYMGIKRYLGPTVVIACFISTRDDPKGEHPSIDLTAKNMAVWLTTPETVGDEVYDFIIGPDGFASGIAFMRSDGLPYKYRIKVNSKAPKIEMTEIKDVIKSKSATFLNLPEGASAQVITKEYPSRGLQESYTIITLPGDAIKHDIKEFFPFVEKRILISGMKNRGLNFNLTGLWASRITNRSNLPFGRELPRKK